MSSLKSPNQVQCLQWFTMEKTCLSISFIKSIFFYNPKIQRWESLELIEYIEDAFPESKPNLLPKDSYDRWRYKIFAKEEAHEFIKNMFAFLEDEHKKQLFEDALNQVECAIVGPYVLGEEYTIADISFISFLERAEILLSHYRSFEIAYEKYPKLKKFRDLVFSRKAVQQTMVRLPNSFHAAPGETRKEYLINVFYPFFLGKKTEVKEKLKKIEPKRFEEKEYKEFVESV